MIAADTELTMKLMPHLPGLHRAMNVTMKLVPHLPGLHRAINLSNCPSQYSGAPRSGTE